MSRRSLILMAGSILLLVVATSACAGPAYTAVPTSSTATAPATAVPSATAETYSDPFAYCAATGTVDAPDARYTGDAVPDVIIQGYLKAAGLEGNGEPEDMLKQTTTWRCMNQAVYACNFGANLPCNSKANTDKTPTQAMKDYCTADGNTDSDFIPMSVTGHATIYSWHCVNGAPELLDQIDQVDAEGYLSSIWYQLHPTP
jgi:hypothetical protein